MSRSRVVFRGVIVGMLSVALLSSLCLAAKTVVLCDFSDEEQFKTWDANDAHRYAGKQPNLGSIELNKNKEYVLTGLHSIKFNKVHVEGLQSNWVSFQFKASGYWSNDNWDPDGCLHVWIKGDGSGEKFGVEIFDNIIGKRFFAPQFTLDSTEWKKYSFPFASFKIRPWEGDESVLDYWDFLSVYGILINYDAESVKQDVEFYLDRIEVDVY